MQKPGGFIGELRRRNVIRMAGLYLVVSWLLVQVSSTILPMFAAPDWLPRSIVVLVAIGFVPALVFAWVYEITPEGVKRESEIEQHESITPQTGRRMDRAIIVVLALAVVVFAVDRFVVAPRREAKAVADAVEQARATVPANGSASAAGPGAANASIPEIETDPSIAVLPLTDLSQGHDQAYFSDGISEELLNLLAKVPKLRVIARTSSFSFKGKDTPIPDIARALNVAALLEGSVRKAGDTVRITVELIRATDGTQLWSENYNRKLDDIFKIQDEIAATVVEQLKIKMLGAAPMAKPVDPKAFALILQAQALLDQASTASRVQAERLFRQALDIAPNEARAWAGLARIYVNQMLLAERPSDEAARLVNDAANRALAIEPDNPLALAQLARVASEHDLDLAAAARYYQRILDKEPGNLHGINGAASLLKNIGRTEQALLLMEYRIAHDPANCNGVLQLGKCLGRCKAMGHVHRSLQYRVAPESAVLDGSRRHRLCAADRQTRRGGGAEGVRSRTGRGDATAGYRTVAARPGPRQGSRRRAAVSRRQVRERSAGIDRNGGVCRARRYRRHVRVAGQGDRRERSRHNVGLERTAFRFPARRSALADVPAQDRLRAGAAGEGRVQGDAAKSG